MISVGGISPLETKKLSQENDHLKRLLVENIFFLFFVKKKYTNGQKLILL
ncbi:transposase [Paenibacillus larvae subsp. larvae]|uniref:Transposase n=2 Tax=Paenibacillus larvae subsp. larvae TaxID=147375 RepID=V9W432_9BACL|nr:transposase [Paenibacillus larvae subsp. larvae DSM 25430]AVF20380.1 transposase [Paenibacillus larvae subsp. larvae]ETK28673.1 transposase [Paenibacillus larvae subsp. larvae DSM 25719]QHZ53602.1 transposase [Paenibacillus larvae subsp. larvae]